jgi:hypothetical protein
MCGETLNGIFILGKQLWSFKIQQNVSYQTSGIIKYDLRFLRRWLSRVIFYEMKYHVVH